MPGPDCVAAPRRLAASLQMLLPAITSCGAGRSFPLEANRIGVAAKIGPGIRGHVLDANSQTLSMSELLSCTAVCVIGLSGESALETCLCCLGAVPNGYTVSFGLPEF